MKPFKHIKEVSDIINDLKFELQHSKNKVRDAKRINSLIDCVNAFESILDYEYKVSEIDNLLAYIFRDFMLRLVGETDINDMQDIPMATFIHKLDLHLQQNSETNINWLADDIKTYEISKHASRNDIEAIKKIPDNDIIIELIKKLFLEYKIHMKWRKK